MADRTCCEDDCEAPVMAVGRCGPHYRRARKTGQIPARACTLDGCTNVRYGRGLCHNHYEQARRRAALPERNPYNHRDRQLQKRYGLSALDFDRMLASQNGRCLVCEKPGARMVVDHDHATGAVRGILCHTCNTAIGLLRDDPDVALRASMYLLRNDESPSAGRKAALGLSVRT